MLAMAKMFGLVYHKHTNSCFPDPDLLSVALLCKCFIDLLYIS